MNIQLTAPCHFGLEAVLKRELKDLGFKITEVNDGRVSFSGNEKDVCRANILLRTADRILIDVTEFDARTFDELFEQTKRIPWERYIPKDGRFWVKKASTVTSALHAAPSIQSIMKKAMVARLQDVYGISQFPETGAPYPVRILIKKNHARVYLDTSGDPLHKRGYRTTAGDAPISETLAAALILLTPYHADRILIDPFCGSGTIPIEAAMIAADIAPGMHRTFTAQAWKNLIPAAAWKEAFAEAEARIRHPEKTDIQGYDIDDKVLATARSNAEAAGVADMIHFQKRDVGELRHAKKYGFVITNPPYGERLNPDDLRDIYSKFGKACAGLDDWSVYMITAFRDAEHCFGRKADRKRKVYNGMIRADYLQFPGPKPPRRKRES